NTRHEEPASTGIYYFKRWDIFKKYAAKTMQCGFGNLTESYVSLLFNYMIADKLKILVTYVNKFICLGTPEDLIQCLFWSQYHNNRSIKHPPVKNQINLIPMAGKGSRFRKYGYKISKPLIQIDSLPMVVKACNSFPNAESWIFAVRTEDLRKFPINKTLK